jgi:hypothetical protein
VDSKPPPPDFTLGPDTITVPFPVSLDDLDRFFFLAALDRAGSGRAAAKLLSRSAAWAEARCFENDISHKKW